MTIIVMYSMAVAILRVTIDSAVIVYWNTAGQSPGS